MNRDSLIKRIKSIQIRHNFSKIRDLGDVIGISENRLYSFMNGRIKKYDDIKNAIDLHFSDSLNAKQDGVRISSETFDDPYDAVEDYKRITKDIKRLEIEIETLKYKRKLIKEKFGGSGWSALD